MLVMAIKTEAIRQKLLVNKKPENSIAAYGTSIETIAKIIKQGYIPPIRKEMARDYAFREMKENDGLYFATPFVPALRRSLPEVENTIRQSLIKFDTDAYSHFVSDGSVLWQSQLYATAHALSDSFEAATGLRKFCNDILVVASETVPDALNRQFSDVLFRNAHTSLSAISELAEPEDVDDILKRIPSDKLNDILPKCLDRRGGIIYYGNKFVEGGKKTFPGVEDELEIFVIASQDIKLDAIIGIEILSFADEHALNELVK